MSRYSEKKLQRRHAKYTNILAKNTHIRTVDTSKVIMICNCGLANGVDQSMVFEKFNIYGELENIVMMKEETFSFVIFKHLDSALVAFTELQNTTLWNSLKGPVYLSFVDGVPSCKSDNIIERFKGQPSGLYVFENFVSEAEEQILLNSVIFEDSDETAKLKNRQVRHFGYEFKYGVNNVDSNEPIEKLPAETEFLWQRLSEYKKIKCNHCLKEEEENCCHFDFSFEPEQLTVNYYKPGQGIPPHVDTHSAFEGSIISLSLLSDIVMEFKNIFGDWKSVVLPRRSLCIMSGESRLGWTHGIVPRKYDIVPDELKNLILHKRRDRISFTFRKLKKTECSCDFHQLCDSYKKRMNHTEPDIISEDQVAVELEKTYVHQVYDEIATHFSDTRHKPWPNVLDFVNSFSFGSLLIDIGCGNGKYFGLNQNIFEIGCDCSSHLLKICRERGFQSFTCNCLYLPVRDSVADGCISIAVIHHLATEARRIQALSEMVRILKIGGKALVYVWAKNQEREEIKSSYLKQQRKNRKEAKINEISKEEVQLNKCDRNVVLPVHTNRTNFKYKDLLVPWKLKQKNNKLEECQNDKSIKETTFLRFYHVFEDSELLKLCEKIENIQVLKYYYDQGNWCVLFEKIS